jgi:hypothetical protein
MGGLIPLHRVLLNGTSAVTVVPFPGADSTLKVPATISIRSRIPISPKRANRLA